VVLIIARSEIRRDIAYQGQQITFRSRDSELTVRLAARLLVVRSGSRELIMAVNCMKRTIDTFRVVGVRPDQGRHVMAIGLSYNDACFVIEALLKAKIFYAVVVESDESPATDGGNGEAGTPHQESPDSGSTRK
jgi:hypothetical protein